MGPVLRCFRSYLVGRSQHARHGSTTSTAVHLICNGTVPGYLQSRFTRLADMTPRQRLRSSASYPLAVPQVRPSTVVRRAFPVSGARTQCLPSHVTSSIHVVLHRHSRFSGSVSKHSYFPVHTRTSSLDFHFYCICGPT